jgi:hypothetical protein
MTNIGAQPTMTFLDNPHAPDVFADALTGFFLLNGNIRLTFESARVNHSTSPGPVTRVVIGRLVIPIAIAENMAKELLAFIEQMKQQHTQTSQSTTTVQ